MRIGITGSTGFIGSHLYKKCWHVGETALDIGRSNADVGKLDVIYHLATKYVKYPTPSEVVEMADANYAFGLKWLDFAFRNKVKFIYTTSYFEDNPKYLYSLQKKQFSDLVRFYGSQGLKYHIVKIFNTYGENDKRNLFLSRLYRGETVTIKDPNESIQYSHIRDVVDYLYDLRNFEVSGESEVPHKTSRIGSLFE